MSDLPHIEAALQQAAEFVQATWQQAVTGSQTLPGMQPIKLDVKLKQIYADSIVTGRQIVGGNAIRQSVIAIKKIAEQLENGTGPWDMKPMLLNGPKARVGKHGKYNIIPFRHSVPGGSASSSMPQQVYKQARELKATIKQGNSLKWGGRLPAQGAPGTNRTTGYQHKNNKHEGMVRIEHTYAKATQSKYMTFRVVSERSDPGSWIHPGYEAHHIAAAVSNFCKPAVEKMLQDAAVSDIQAAIVKMGLGKF